MENQIYTIQVPNWVLENLALDDLLTGLEALYKTKFRLEESVVVHTSSAQAKSVLEMAFRQGKNGQTEEPAAQKKVPTRKYPAWSVEGEDETFSTKSLNSRLAKHELAPGTRLSNPKHGKKVVIAGLNPNDPYRLVDAGSWKGESS